MLEYFQPITTADGYTVSIDNIVLDFHISEPKNQERFLTMLSSLMGAYYCDVKHWTHFGKCGEFKEHFTVTLNDSNSFWLGVGLMEKKMNYGRVRLDFNPNKVANHQVFRAVLSNLHMLCRKMHTKIARYDLAIDIPIDRFLVFLKKDNRVYNERRHGQEYTQYLGRMSHSGRVKLYNKQRESKLSYPLTRLELSLEPLTPYEKLHMPVVYCIRDRQIGMEGSEQIGKLSDTDNFILEAVLEDLGKLDKLSRRKRDKIEQVLAYLVDTVTISKKDFEAVQRQLQYYIDPYNTHLLNMENVDMDAFPLTRKEDTLKLCDFVEIESDGDLPFD